jgi:peptidoglycan/LPS O-acetylase OafA/YrhL
MTQGVQPAAQSPRRLPEIEVLRGLAVAGVVLHHSYGALLPVTNRPLAWLMHTVDYGTGVDLFFAISGFVIARTLLPAIDASKTRRDFTTTACAFWIRRAWRLLPSAWLWLAICLAASAWFNRAGLFGSVATNAWAALAGALDFANIRLALIFGHHDYGTSFAWWSLSLEEQFYILLPPAAFLLRGRLQLILIALVALQFPLRPHSLWPVMFRNQAILLGVLLACWEPHPSFRRVGWHLARWPAFARWIPAAALVLMLGALGVAGPAPRFMIGLIALTSAALVYLAAQDAGLIMQASALRRVMLWLGARSYALYLIHIPAFFAARELCFRLGAQDNEPAAAFLGLALLLIGAELNWRLLENPLRRRGARIAQRYAAKQASASF